MNAKYRSRLSALTLVCTLGALLLPLKGYAGPFYSIVPLDFITLGGTDTIGVDFNDKGQIIGDFTVDSTEHAFLYSNGNLRDLGTLGGPDSQAIAINDRGQVAGVSDTAESTPFGPVSDAFLYSNGNMKNLGSLGGSVAGNESFAAGINNSGQVVGSSFTTTDAEHAFLYSNGVMEDLGTLPGTDASRGQGINDRGQVTGVSFNESGSDTSYAFLYTDGSMQNLGSLGGGGSEGVGISDNGQVTGSSLTTADNYQAFLYSNGSMEDIGALLGGSHSYSTGYGVNDRGQVVGEYTGGPGGFGAFLYSDGSMYDLNNVIGNASSCVFLSEAYTIGNSGEILASGNYDKNGTNRYSTFLLIPSRRPYSGAICAAPEPGTLGLLGLGLTGLGLTLRRRCRV